MLFYVFVSSRRRHTRCALVTGVHTCAHPISVASIADKFGINRWNVSAACTRVRSRRRSESLRAEFADWRDVPITYSGLPTRAQDAIRAMRIPTIDRKSVVSGKRGSVCVDLGGRRWIKKQKNIYKYKKK